MPEVVDWQRAADAGHERRSGAVAAAGSTAIRRSLLDRGHRLVPCWTPERGLRPDRGQRSPADGGTATRFLPLTNVAASPYRYLIDPDEQLRAMLDIDDADEMVWGIVHSHVMSPAVPSDTDVGLAAYPDALYLICSLRGERPRRPCLVHPGWRRHRGGAARDLTDHDTIGTRSSRHRGPRYSPMSSFQISGWSRMKSRISCLHASDSRLTTSTPRDRR